ncbi:hypothetical protein [Sporosarcina gallistercoris]|uniref:Uncharacterized protein n=1 Tax=Sporosarcina gallistercoris TaxID=2762245 RepID=A0ABR8PJV4_9BACL|nr:hypothetical protein [Sporosarcina gallistercoris]MBD7908436.1 hypothetical protein [Sporosarcina gallistercoris]
MKFFEARVKKWSSKKLYERLTRLRDEKAPDTKSISTILSEIAKRDPAEYETGKIEAIVEKYKRHAVMESTDILHLEIQYNEDYLAKAESETDPLERKIRAAQLDVVQKELKSRKN